MKANTPERIWIDPATDLPKLSGHIDKDSVEYIRKDAFVEKACEWLKENFLFDEAGYCRTNIYSTESMIYNFKNTLGGKL